MRTFAPSARKVIGLAGRAGAAQVEALIVAVEHVHRVAGVHQVGGVIERRPRGRLATARWSPSLPPFLT